MELLDILTGIGNIAGQLPSIINSFQLPPGAQPGDLPGADLAFGDPMTRTFFAQPRMDTYRPQRVVLPDPTGKLHFFAPMGRPMLFSGDLAAVRRVQRVASKASRRVGRRRGGR